MLFESHSLRLEADDQIATLWLDVRDQKANRLTIELLGELERALDVVQEQAALEVLILRSGRSNGFLTGPDPQELLACPQEEDLLAWAQRGQQLLQRLEQLSPTLMTVAFIDGPCLGAGLELALACDYRLAVARPSTELGLPQVTLGIPPCHGATVRLPRLIGLAPALDLLLTGRLWSAREARREGLVDHAFCARRAAIELRTFVDSLQDFPRKPNRQRGSRSWSRRLVEATAWGRYWIRRPFEREIKQSYGEDRPAAREIMRAVQLGWNSPTEGMLHERKVFAQLVPSSACQTACRLAWLSEQPIKVYPEPIHPVPPLPEKIAVVGAGQLGARLVHWLAVQGRQVVLQEANDRALAQASERVDALLDQSADTGWITPLEAETARRAIRRTVDWQDFDQVGLVIEAVGEDPHLKRGIFQELEDRCRPRTILVSTSSMTKITTLQAELNRPGRVAGLHFLSADFSRQLVEIVRAAQTDSLTLATLDRWMRQLGQRTILVSDRPGRLVLPLHWAYLSEAVSLVAEGLPPDRIDQTMRRFGMLWGPLEWIDRFGFTPVADWTRELQNARGDRFARNLLFDRLRSLGFQGQANGEGFYMYHRGRKRPNELARVVMWNDLDEDAHSHYIFNTEEALRDGCERLVLRTINEAAALLGEEQSADANSIDLGLTLGVGWAPHRGGPLRYADQCGLADIVDRLQRLAKRYGPRFEPCLELQRRAEAGETFHGTLVSLPEEDAPALKLSLRRLAG